MFVLAALVDAGRAQEGIFELGRHRPSEVIVTIGEETPSETMQPPMALRLQGVLAVWRGRRHG